MKPAYDVEGKVVLITGAARGIGAQTARVLAERGATLALVGLEPDNLATVAKELGPQHLWRELDVTHQDATDRVVAEVAEQLGGIDVVMTNAGVGSYGTVRQIDPAAFQRVIDINLTGMFRTAHSALPHVIERRGYILVVSSLAAFSPIAGMAAYDASKSGVEAFALAMRQELLHLGVDVGICHPSWVDTDLVRNAEAGPAELQGDPEHAAVAGQLHHLGRRLRDDDRRRDRQSGSPDLRAEVGRGGDADALADRVRLRRTAGAPAARSSGPPPGGRRRRPRPPLQHLDDPSLRQRPSVVWTHTSPDVSDGSLLSEWRMVAV